MARLPRTLKQRLELAGVPTPLEQAAVPKEWFVPEDIELRHDQVCWRPSTSSPEFPHFKVRVREADARTGTARAVRGAQ